MKILEAEALASLVVDDNTLPNHEINMAMAVAEGFQRTDREATGYNRL